MDERRDARPGVVSSGRQAQDLSHRLPRRRHAHRALRGLRARRRTRRRSCPCSSRPSVRRGIPKRLYVDNGAAYRSHHLALVCAKLGITPHPRPSVPAAGQGQAGALVPDGAHAAAAAARPERHRAASKRSIGASGPGSRASTTAARTAASTARRRSTAGRMSADDVRSQPTLDLDDLFLFEAEAPGARGPHRQPRRRRLRGRRRARRRDRHAALRPRAASARTGPGLARRSADPRWPSAVDIYANCFVQRDGARRRTSRPPNRAGAACRGPAPARPSHATADERRTR